MKKYLFSFLSLLCFELSFAQKANNLQKNLNQRLAASTVNLIPDNPGTTPNYWCTWSAQNFAVDSTSLVSSIGMGDHRIFSDNLTEKAVFDNPAWEEYFPQEIKKDLFLVLDVGWDIEQGTVQDKSKWVIGSMNIATDKFPFCTGNPAEKLKKLNELCKMKGWKGAGLWVAAQTEMDSRNQKNISDEEVELYYRLRARWCKEAGIQYWKVDYGSRGGSVGFRQMLTRIAAQEDPELLVEHGRGGGPLNDEECPWDTPNFYRKGSYRTWDSGAIVKKAAGLLLFSDVLRTYDVTAQLSIPTTIDRVAQTFAEIQNQGIGTGKGLINCEDEPYIAASLGCAMGIMRHPLFIAVKGNDYNPLQVHNLMDEVTRAVRWQRIAPAFGSRLTSIMLDTAILQDTWLFNKGDSWAAWMINKSAMQSAPAVVCRGLAMTQVKVKKVNSNPPFVLASKNPGGAITIATLKRVNKDHFYFPLADVALTIDSANYIGVFGRYQSLQLIHHFSTASVNVFAQDLAGNKAIDITDLVHQKNNIIHLSGKLLQYLGTMQGNRNDRSEPGLLLYITKK